MMGSVDGFMALPACSLQLRRSDMKRWSHGGFTMRDTMTLRPEGRVVLKQNNLFEEREAVAVSETAMEPDNLQTCLLPILGFLLMLAPLTYAFLALGSGSIPIEVDWETASILV
ncbi:hypothetical protein GUITHDRAFT_154005 [Guillardia theta CCMP2712]|uniref:Uncharacterized protein n=1 Tax=Guillardia theta (strain CCMP2712) TaxID=905079 RepID=L1IXK4_GUITC|nr:hypothetical protein GUITHDRAFT_154005 [Guillardia theta CCMP2712]EKX40802.1 hypothetical protein GUITHDRAFT_154005 [Guillardia theta CCMP2712]|eukprot:XP_005827782.1 hypothetical protein GUITHDRAFT_154005 [Guillardia theta CCMP2712]